MTVSRYFAVALGLLYIGQQENSEAIIEGLAVVSHPISKYAAICIEGCAYIGSGNVLKCQKMLQFCVDHIPEKDAMFQQVALISLALIASSEDIGKTLVLTLRQRNGHQTNEPHSAILRNPRKKGGASRNCDAEPFEPKNISNRLVLKIRSWICC